MGGQTREGGGHDGVRGKKRERESKRSARERKKDNFLALLLNKSVSIATIQPATGEMRGKWGCTGETREGWRERVTIATEEEGRK